MRETWYVLENGKAADPNEVAPDKDGVLRHKSGVAVGIGPHGPLSMGVDPEEERSAAADDDEDESKPARRDMKAGGKRRYQTRETKAD